MIFKSGISVRNCLEQTYEYLQSHELFYGHGTDNAWDEACWLLESVLKESGFKSDGLMTEEKLVEVFRLLQCRVNEKKPLAYLLKQAWFAGMLFNVDERVLIPRSPIAELILNRFQPLLHRTPQRILDLCTGSGCIGIATAMAFPDALVDIADLSLDALTVAESNIRRHQLASRVSIIQSDLFANIDAKYDLIVSNPPYVSLEEYAELPEEYHQEPPIGLVTGDSGLAIPVRIIADAAEYLTQRGILILEVGHSWQLLAKHLPHAPFLWLEFEFGGEGVCLLTANQLRSSSKLDFSG